MTAQDFQTVRRAFLTVGDRQVHYRYLGNGPPALFIHSSPTNGSFVVGDMQAQADRFTCFAFDTPGFGLSDPLPLTEMKVADLADAIAAAMEALGLPPVPVFGTHSGAAIALELGYRYPEKVTGLVLDGVPIFTREEVEPMLGVYFAPLVTDVLGGHFSATWTRFRDQNIWFPWCFRVPENLNEYDLAPPENTHRWTEMFFAAAAHYKPAYRAVTCYCEDAIEAAAGLSVPAVFTATTTDMLYGHLKRLPSLRGDQDIVEIGTGYTRKYALTAERFAQFGSPGEVPAAPATLESCRTIRRQFVMDDARAQFVRYLGDRSSPVLLLLHDTPGSSLTVEPLMQALANDYFVIAPDIPGSGESPGLGPDADVADYAAALLRMVDGLGLSRMAIQATGFAASIAIEMAIAAPDRCDGIMIDGLLLPDEAERRDMQARFAPPIEITADGSHWYRLWLSLRDSLVYWPWYRTERAALRRAATIFDADTLHGWAVEVMKQHDSYHHFIQAALRHDAAARAASVPVAMTIAGNAASAMHSAYFHRITALLSPHYDDETKGA